MTNYDDLDPGIRDPDSPEQLAAERKCCDLFMALSEAERASALALNDGFWEIAAKETP